MNTAALLVVFGGEFLIAQYLQLVLGLSPLEAGLWTLPSAAGFIVGSMVAPALVRRVRPGLVVAAGLALAAAGFVLLTRVDGASGLEVVVAGSVLLALGAAPVVTLSTDLVVGAAPPERAGVASGLSETAAELGGALGIAILGSIGAAVYRREVADQVPAGVPADAADAARDTLGGALGAAEELPGRLLDAATDAFAQGFQVAAVVSAILMAALAAVALRVLRSAGGNPGHDT
jgi:DHA2 family multidrug resistance protein-like MFS transporter